MLDKSQIEAEVTRENAVTTPEVVASKVEEPKKPVEEPKEEAPKVEEPKKVDAEAAKKDDNVVTDEDAIKNIFAALDKIKNGADCSKILTMGPKLLAEATANHRYVTAARNLLKAGINKDKMHGCDESAISNATLYSGCDVIKQLAEANNLVALQKQTSQLLIQELTQRWMSIQEKQKFVIHKGTPDEEVELFEVFLKAKLDPNGAAIYNTTTLQYPNPIHQLVKFKDEHTLKIIKHFLDYGIDVTAKTPGGKTALELAKEANNEGAVKLLTEKLNALSANASFLPQFQLSTQEAPKKEEGKTQPVAKLA